MIQDSTIPREWSPGQHLEVATLEGNFSIPWATLTPPLNGHTTEMSITACLEDKMVSASIRYLYDSSIMNPEITKRIKDQNKAAMEMRNLERLQTKWANSKFYKTLDKEIKSE